MPWGENRPCAANAGAQEALKEALKQYGKPAIFNTDQGSQFTSVEFTGLLDVKGMHGILNFGHKPTKNMCRKLKVKVKTRTGKIKVGRVQIEDSFSGQKYLTYVAELLQRYFQQRSERRDEIKFLLSLYRRLPVKQAVDALKEARDAGFNRYLWAFRFSTFVVDALTVAHARVLIVCGGSQVSDWEEDCIHENLLIDLCTQGAIEHSSLQTLEIFNTRDGFEQRRDSCFNRPGQFQHTPKRADFNVFNEISSFFLKAFFVPLKHALHQNCQQYVLLNVVRC